MWRGILVTMLCGAAFAISGVGDKAEAAVNAVELHKSSLPGPVTVWCLGNEREFAFAAEALGMGIGGEASSGNFTFPGGNGRLILWARSGDPEAKADFEEACRLAYEAFSRSEAREQSSDEWISDDAKAGLAGTALGGVIAAATAAGGVRLNRRRREAADLVGVSTALQDAVRRYVAAPAAPFAPQDARAIAAELDSLLGEWLANGHAETEIRKARAALAELLDSRNPVPPARIGNLGEPEEEKERGKELVDAVKKLHSHIDAIAGNVGNFWRTGDRVPEGGEK